jgi:hypothetical protein
MRSWKLAAAAVAVAALAGAGIAYATIPGPGNVYTACMLKGVGTVRLIDPSLPSSNLMSKCTSVESQVTWNQQGQPGTPGADGQPGQSVAMGDAGANCANGGVSLTVGSDTRYVCNGADGQAGQDGVFTGHFQSPNGQYKIDVTDTGVLLTGAQGKVRLDSTGITVDSSAALSLKSSGNTELKASGGMTVEGSGTTLVKGSLVQLNGCSGGVARLGDPVTVNPMSGFGNIVLGSTTVCAG